MTEDDNDDEVNSESSVEEEFGEVYEVPGKDPASLVTFPIWLNLMVRQKWNMSSLALCLMRALLSL